jgi:hypothetical protein
MFAMRACLAMFVAAFVLLLTSTPVFPHHSFLAEFDAKQPIRVTGTVTKVEWQNPHTWFYIDVKDDSGKVANWGMEMGSPNLLLRLGWARNSLKIGDVVTVEASRAKDGSNIANAKTVILASTGQKLFAGSSQVTSTR